MIFFWGIPNLLRITLNIQIVQLKIYFIVKLV